MILHTVRNNHSRFEGDYAAYTGQLVRTVSTTFYDSKLGAWIKRTCEYIDVGRPDPLVPIDPNAQMEPEELEDSNDKADKARPIKEAWLKRHAELQERISDYLIEYGPSRASLVAQDLDISLATLLRHLRLREDEIYHETGKTKNAILWGLVGVHDKEAA